MVELNRTIDTFLDSTVRKRLVMNTRRLLALIALPVIVGTFGCVALNQAIAQSPNRLAQNSSQPNQQ